jgi:hypothetical protein
MNDPDDGDSKLLWNVGRYPPDFQSDDGGSKLLWNVGQYLPDYMVPHFRRQPYSIKILLPTEDTIFNIKVKWIIYNLGKNRIHIFKV